MKPRPCPTRSSGASLSVCAAETAADGPHPLGELTVHATADGSISLHSSHFKESFHHSAGALAEAQAKFVLPAQLQRFSGPAGLRILDVCVGLGYNSAAVIAALEGNPCPLTWWGLELDPRPLTLALQQQSFCEIWPQRVIERLQALRDQGCWHQPSSEGQMIWGDARQGLSLLPEGLRVDLILLDAFSPARCPELWSEDFLKALAERLAPGGRLLTYCRAAAVRASLRRTGLQLMSLLPSPGERQGWSSGTMAIRPDQQGNPASSGPGWRSLSPMENEHLLTRAAIPYRDPQGNAGSSEILQRRSKEQQGCDLESTNAWQRRWMLNQPQERPGASL